MARGALVLLIVGVLCFEAAEAASKKRSGEIAEAATEYGSYWYYRPLGRVSHLLVIVHGTPGKDETAREAARRFIERWTRFADERRTLLIAPAFDRRNFGGHEGPGGGYRGLFGRDVGADTFTLDIVDGVRADEPHLGSAFLLYGHSAGAQFACRFVLTHPSRVHAVVLSAPGRYAFPDEDARWPYGLKPVERELRWSNPTKVRTVRVEPDVENWVRAATQPVFVIVGSEDLDPQPVRPGHDGAGKTRVSFARAWTRAMRDLARRSTKLSRIELQIVDGVGHSSRRLTPAAKKTFVDLVSP